MVTGGNSSVFCPAVEEGKWKLQPGVSFLFFTSHTPCESSMHSVVLTGCLFHPMCVMWPLPTESSSLSI